MKDSNEKENLQEQEIQRLKEALSNYEVETLVSSPRVFNKWMLSEILKLKEATNQIGAALNIILSSYEQAEAEEQIPEPTPEPKQSKWKKVEKSI